MGRSQRHLREQRGIDSKGRTAQERTPPEPSRKTPTEQTNEKAARGYPNGTPSTN